MQVFYYSIVILEFADLKVFRYIDGFLLKMESYSTKNDCPNVN